MGKRPSPESEPAAGSSQKCPVIAEDNERLLEEKKEALEYNHLSFFEVNIRSRFSRREKLNVMNVDLILLFMRSVLMRMM